MPSLRPETGGAVAPVQIRASPHKGAAGSLRLVAEPHEHQETPADRVWREYGRAFRAFDDITLARWCSQTLGQLHGKAWRMSHPLVAALRLAAHAAHERSIWQQRLVNIPLGYAVAECCGAPLLPYLTRDVGEQGLCCLHCNETAIPLAQLPDAAAKALQEWSRRYAPVHEVAHWEEKRVNRPDYDQKLEDAAHAAEELLVELAEDIVPLVLDSVPAILWEDQDECLEVRPEDIQL